MDKFHTAFLASGKKLALAESCTGGALAAAITRNAGASQFFLGSVVAYSDAWKKSFLDVSTHTLTKHGAVSANAVTEMVAGLFAKTEADIAVAISGFIGPTGGTKEAPLGTVFIAIALKGKPPHIERLQISSDTDRKTAIDNIVQHTLEALLIHV